MEQGKNTVEQGRNMPDVDASMAHRGERISSMVLSFTQDFQKQISEALEKQVLSEEEHQWWHQGVFATLDQHFDEEKTMKILQELREYFRENIILNTKKRELRQKITRVMGRSHMTSEEQSLWEQKLVAIDTSYSEQRITLQQSLMEMGQLYELVSSCALSDDSPLKMYRDVETICDKVSLQHFHYLHRSDIIPYKQYVVLSGAQRIDALQKIMRKVGEEFSSFCLLYPAFAQSSKSAAKWGETKTISQKIRLISRMYTSMRGGEQKRLQERKSLEGLIRQKQLSKASGLLEDLRRKLHADTFSFFGFTALDKQVQEALSLRSRFIGLASQQEKSQHYAEALRLLFQAQDIESDPFLQHHIATVSQKEHAENLYHKGVDFLREGKTKEGQQLMDQARALNPLLPLPEGFTGSSAVSPLSSQRDAQDEIKRVLLQDDQYNVLTMEEYIIKKIRKTTTEEGKSTLTKKTLVTKQISEKHVVSLESASSAGKTNKPFIRLKTERDNVKEVVQDVFRSAQEGKLTPDQMIFQRNDEEASVIHIEEAAISVTRKKQELVKRKKEAIVKKYNLESLPDDDLAA